jgi:serine/threonine protein kinase
VAIKVAAFPGILKDPARGKLYTHLFLNEAALVGKLSHPHIVQTYDAVVDDHLCYIVMEYVAGGTLETCCTPERLLLPIERVVEIIFKCTRALDFAVRIGITHRDIKPANILFTGADHGNHGDIKISDFGAAIISSPERTLVLGIGSPAYMSPQQVKDQPLDHQTDIYSLGVVMYQLLTGKLPFQARNSYDLIYQIINTEPTPAFGRAQRHSGGARRHRRPGDEQETRAPLRDLERNLPMIWQRRFAAADSNLPRADCRLREVRHPALVHLLRRFFRRRNLGGGALFRMEPGFARHRGHRRRRCRRFFYFLAEGELKVLKNGMILTC